MRQGCRKSAARANLHVKLMTVCGKSVAGLLQVCRRSMQQANFFPMGWARVYGKCVLSQIQIVFNLLIVNMAVTGLRRHCQESDDQCNTLTRKG